MCRPDIAPYKDEYVKAGTLTGDITNSNIPSTKRANGLTITIELLQDSTGSRTISWGNGWVHSTIPSTKADARTILTFRASGGVIYEVAGVTGLA